MSTGRGRHKFARQYSEAEIALYAEYAEQRAIHKPKQCTGGQRCWVRCGPPCYQTTSEPGGICIECQGDVK